MSSFNYILQFEGYQIITHSEVVVESDSVGVGCCSSEEGVLLSFDDVSGGDDEAVSDSSLVVGIG